MKLLTRDTDYAMRAICCIAGSKDKVVSVAELVKNLNMPRPFLRKILQTLNKKGILSSSKGLNGGFAMAVSPRDIYLMDIMNIFQGPFKLNECVFKKRVCPNTDICPLRKKMCSIERFVVSELKGINIYSLIRKHRRHNGQFKPLGARWTDKLPERFNSEQDADRQACRDSDPVCV